MAKQLRRILVAVGDLQHASKNELRKARALARAAGAHIELFHAIDEPDPGSSFPETADRQAVERQRMAIATRRRRRLEQLARHEALQGVSVTCTASWDYPPHEAIVRRAATMHADLVVAAARGHPFGARLLLRNTDWELIRHCPVPLLLVKSRRPYRKPVILAAVDPFHAHARPAHLDAELLRVGDGYARLLRGTLHIFHAYLPLIAVAPVPSARVMLPPEAEQTHARIASIVGELAKSAGVPGTRCHLRMGDVVAELSAVTRRTRCDLVVMGAVSRSALARLFIGNAAERVLDKVSCDVLVVKPRGFKSRVPRRRSAIPP